MRTYIAPRFGTAHLAVLAGLSVLGPMPAADARPADEVVLLSAGKGPKQKLRLRPKVGSSQTLRLVTGQQSTMKMMGLDAPQQALPRTLMSIRLTVASVDPQGLITVNFDTVSIEPEPTPGVDAALMETMRKAANQLKGVSGQRVLDPRGRILSASIRASEDAPPHVQQTLQNFQQNMGQMTIPFPEEPVGIGAKWKVEQRISKLGMVIEQATTITLTKRTANTISVRSTIVQTVGAGRVTLPNLSPGVVVQTKPSQSEGSGQFRMGLDQVGAVGRFDLDLKVKIEMALSDEQLAAEPQTAEMSVSMTMEVSQSEATPRATSK